MKSTSLIGSITGLTLMALTGFASAQSTGTFTISNQGGSTAPAAGTMGATLGTIQLTATQSGQAGNVNLTSLPLTLTSGSGGQASNLSACQVFGPNGAAINTTNSALSNPVNGLNTLIFTTPLQINGGSSLSLSVRCNVASNTTSGATFQFTAASQTSQSFGVTLNPIPVVRPGAQDTLLAFITLSNARSGSAVQLASLPITVSFGGGATASSISDCRVRNVLNLATALNVNSNLGISEGSNTVVLDTPLVIGAGGTATLVLTCDVSSSAPSGGTILVGITPGNLTGSVVGTGTIVSSTTGLTPSGNLGATSGSVLISSSISITSPTLPAGPIIPGAPNTGMGGNANLMMLLASALALFFGVLLLRSRAH